MGCAAGWDDCMTITEYNGNCYSSGFVLDEDDDWIFVAGHVMADMKTQQGGVQVPKAMIRKLVELEVP